MTLYEVTAENATSGAQRTKIVEAENAEQASYLGSDGNWRTLDVSEYTEQQDWTPPIGIASEQGEDEDSDDASAE